MGSGSASVRTAMDTISGRSTASFIRWISSDYHEVTWHSVAPSGRHPNNSPWSVTSASWTTYFWTCGPSGEADEPPTTRRRASSPFSPLQLSGKPKTTQKHHRLCDSEWPL